MIFTQVRYLGLNLGPGTGSTTNNPSGKLNNKTKQKFNFFLEEEPEWHLIIGGKNVTDLSSVELFNWKTGHQCFLQDLPKGVRIHAGLVFDGEIIYCGGYSLEVPQKSCFHFKKDEKNWDQVAYKIFVKEIQSFWSKLNFGKRSNF